MFTNKYPYTDFSELNLDWFLSEFKKIQDEVADLKQTVESFTIIGNPQLAGTEPTLSGLQINEDKYKILNMPAVSSVDAGKFARVNSSGNWIAETVPAAEDNLF